MTTSADAAVRECAVYPLVPGALARGQNFFVHWLDASAVTRARSEHEMLLLLPDSTGAEVQTDAGTERVPGRSVCVLPAGEVTVRLEGVAPAVLIASSRPDLSAGAVCNQADYARPDPRIVASDTGFRRKAGARALQVMEVDRIAPPADKPRLKMFQSETLSINWVEYHDARDRSQLSPHSHTNFEQGSLAIAGHFVHHLRVPWGPNANDWRDDQHLAAAPASMLTVPVNLIHTTEGVGPGRHLLIDVFSPPRADFIAKGWVANAQEYTQESACERAN
ncbi:hypothetical protein [Paraburkholderia bonniea]|uniref:hypothetical protein n=1 Tax=Paraburkholderia bonniea TaxID=2152891 RepID=UPI001291D7CC|nr:hypothetical protein [Paraburkholderia bonniea]